MVDCTRRNRNRHDYRPFNTDFEICEVRVSFLKVRGGKPLKTVYTTLQSFCRRTKPDEYENKNTNDAPNIRMQSRHSQQGDRTAEINFGL